MKTIHIILVIALIAMVAISSSLKHKADVKKAYNIGYKSGWYDGSLETFECLTQNIEE